MNPALWVVLMLLGAVMMVAGVLAAVLSWLPPVPAAVLALAGAAIETPAALAFAHSRRQPAPPQPRR